MTSILRRVIERFGQVVFNTRFAYFEYNGSARSVADIMGVVDRRIEDVSALAGNLLRGVVSGDATVAEWREAFAVELRRAHSQVYALGRGGWAQMTAEDRAAVTERLRGEFGYLQQLGNDIASGNLSEAEIQRRMTMYSKDIKSSFWEGQTVAKEAAGYTEEMRVLGPTHQHCNDCPGYADHWEPIGTLPEPGDACECLGNCLCTKVYQ